MAKNTATFSMVWMVAGQQSIDLPEGLDPNDITAVRNYIKENWDNIPLPTEGDYISGSDELDEDGEIIINKSI